LEVLAKTIADEDALPGAPGKDLIGKIISGDGLASRKDTVTVVVVQARAAGRGEAASVAEQVRLLWIAATTAPPARSSSTRSGTAGPSPRTSATRTTERSTRGPADVLLLGRVGLGQPPQIPEQLHLAGQGVEVSRPESVRIEASQIL
jgi:hypothetical protein